MLATRRQSQEPPSDQELVPQDLDADKISQARVTAWITLQNAVNCYMDSGKDPNILNQDGTLLPLHSHSSDLEIGDDDITSFTQTCSESCHYDDIQHAPPT